MCRCSQGSLVALCTKTSHRVSQRNKLNQMTQKHFVTVMLVKSFCNAQSTNLSSPHSDFTDGLLGSYKALHSRKSDLKWKKEVQKDCLAASLFPLETRASVHLKSLFALCLVTKHCLSTAKQKQPWGGGVSGGALAIHLLRLYNYRHFVINPTFTSMSTSLPSLIEVDLGLGL